MNQKSIIRISGMSLLIFMAPFFIKQALAFGPISGTMSFEVNKPISKATYLQWEIEGATFINVTLEGLEVYNSGADVFFGFTSKAEDEVRKDRLYITFPGDNKTYESESFEDLVSYFLSENSDSDYEVADVIKIKRIDVFVDDSIKFYSITLADNEDFDDPCWRKDARNWRDKNDFLLDGGVFKNADIKFYNSYIQVSKVVGSSSPDYSWWSTSNTGWNQFPYGWGLPFYRWDQSPWNQPSYGWNQPPYSYPYNYPPFYKPYDYQQSYYPDGFWGGNYYVGGPFSNYDYSWSTPYATSFYSNMLNSGFPPYSIGRYPYSFGAYLENYSPGFSIANVPDPYSPNYWYSKPPGWY